MTDQNQQQKITTSPIPFQPPINPSIQSIPIQSNPVNTTIKPINTISNNVTQSATTSINNTNINSSINKSNLTQTQIPQSTLILQSQTQQPQQPQIQIQTQIKVNQQINDETQNKKVELIQQPQPQLQSIQQLKPQIQIQQSQTQPIQQPQQQQPNPADKDSRRLKHRGSSNRNSNSNNTPSHKLLSLHHRAYNELTLVDFNKYLNDVPCELLIECLISNCIKNNQIFHELDNYALSDPTKIRIFIRGLNYDTNKETLAGAFKRFGKVIDSTVIYDKTNNRSKGYGFITFSTSIEAAEACRQGSLEVDGRRTQISLATPLRNKSHTHSSDRDSRRNDNGDRDYRHRRRSRSRSRSRDRDNRRYRKDIKRNSSTHRNNNRFNRNDRNKNDRKSGGRRGFGGNNRNKRNNINNNRFNSNRNNNSNQWIGHQQNRTGVHPPVPHQANIHNTHNGINHLTHTAANTNTMAPTVATNMNPYGGFSYNPYDNNYAAAAAAAAGGAQWGHAPVVNTTANNVNASAVAQPPYAYAHAAQQYTYNPYFAGKQ